MNPRSRLVALALLAGLAVTGGGASAQESGREALSRVDRAAAELESIEARRERAAGGEVELYDALIERHAEQLRQALDGLIARIEQGSAPSGARERAQALLADDRLRLARYSERLDARIKGLREERTGASPERAFAIELELTELDRAADGALAALVADLERLERLGVDVATDRAALDEELSARADLIAARLHLALERRAELERRLAVVPAAQHGPLEARLTALGESIAGSSASLQRMVELLGARGPAASGHRQLLVEASGQLSEELSDRTVLFGLLGETWRRAQEWIKTSGPRWLTRAVVFLLILLLSWVVARFLRRAVRRALERSELKTSLLLRDFAIAAVSKIVMLLGLLFALSQVGIAVGPFLAGLGVAGFIVGFALQDTLSNLASGVMILIYQPYDVDDVIEAGGVSGRVHEMTLVSTTVLTFDNKKLVVPNNKIWGSVIQNVTAQTTRRVDLMFGISYDSDIEHAERILADIVEQHPLVIDEPPPVIRLHQLADSSVNFVVRPWTLREDYWTVYWDITREVKRRFDAEGIAIPFPQRDVHLYTMGTGEERAQKEEEEEASTSSTSSSAASSAAESG